MKSIIQYIRNQDGRKIGALVATSEDGKTIKIGWSLCNDKDTFNKEFAKKIAFGRAEKSFEREYIVPTKIIQNVLKFEERVCKYFPDVELIADIGAYEY
jgi:hypothetical protein